MSKTKSITFIITAFLLFVPILLSAGTIQLPQTGQTKCYDTNGVEINCIGTGQDREIRAGVAWPNPRFVITYCDTNSPCTDQSSDCDNNASTDVITDNLTGLMWVRDGNLAGVKDWYKAMDYTNSLTLCGYSDYRLPNINEIESLLNTEELYPSTWLNYQGFINVQYNWYWSSTSRAATVGIPSADSAWVISMMVGGVGSNTKDGGPYYLLPVRAGQFGITDSAYPANVWKTGQTAIYYLGDDGDIRAGVSWPSVRFTDNPDATVTDNLTGLIWTNGDVYDGEWKCKRTGQGVYTTKDGYKYVGSFVDGKRHGRGKETWANGNSYDGEWRNDKRHGEGVFSWKNGGKYVGKFEYDREVGGWYYYANGSKEWLYRNVDGKWSNQENVTPMPQKESKKEETKSSVPITHTRSYESKYCLKCRTSDIYPYPMTRIHETRLRAGLCPRCEGKLVDYDKYRKNK